MTSKEGSGPLWVDFKQSSVHPFFGFRVATKLVGAWG
jgi:hypothetical protein